MAVALRAYTQGTTQASGIVAINWPTGTAAGDLAIISAHRAPTEGSGPVGPDWKAYAHHLWSKRVTAADLAAPLTVYGKVTFLQTFTGCAGIGTYRDSDGLKVTIAGGGVLINARGPSRIGTITPGSTGRLGNQVRLITDNTPNAMYWLAHTTAGYKKLADDDDDCTYAAYELLPIAGPLSPTLVSPVAGVHMDAAAGVPLTWIHQTSSASTQEQVQLRIRVVGSGTWSYVQTGGTISTTVTTLTQSTETKTINQGVLASGSLYEWSAATWENGTQGAYSANQTFTPLVKPVVDTIDASSPNNDLTPAITWVATMGSGSQDAWQVRIVDAANATPDAPLWDSLIQGGSATTAVPPATTEWVNGQDLYAWVRVSQTGGLWSVWTKAASTFQVTWTPPAPPNSVTAADTPGGSPGLAVTVTGVGIGYTLDVQSSADGGTTWAEVTSITADTVAEVIPIPLAPFGVPIQYRGRTSTQIDSVTMWSDWVISDPTACTDPGTYLVSTDGQRYLPVAISAESPIALVQGVSITYGHGSTIARQDQTVPMGRTGQTTIITHDYAAQTAAETWLSTEQSWWLRYPPERTVGVGLVNKPAIRMALGAPLGTTRIIQSAHASRTITFTWVEQ